MRRIEKPTLGEVQAVQAIARFEGGYGENWKGAGFGSHNWGAVQCRRAAPCPEGCFQQGDSDHAGRGYQACFRRYESAVAGAADFLMEIYRRAGVPEALRTGDARAIAHKMRAALYFTAPVEDYATAMEKNARDIAKILDEPHVVYRGIRKGDAAEVTRVMEIPPVPEPAPPAPAAVPIEPEVAPPVEEERGGPSLGWVLAGIAAAGLVVIRMRTRQPKPPAKI